MKQFIFISFLICGYALSVDCLSCFSTAQGVGGSGTSISCAQGTGACYKATSAIRTQAGAGAGNVITAQAIFGNMVLSTGWSILGTTAFTATGLVEGDRGCLPILGAAAAQTTSAQMTLVAQTGAAIGVAAGVASDAVFADYGLIVTVLCSTHGVCCTTFNCNSSYILIRNIYLISLLLSIAIAKLIS